jgi:hypothetical protein
MYTVLCNIQKNPQPYSENKKLDTYYSYGDYYTSDITEGTTYDGDTYIMPMEYVSMHKIYFDVAYDTIPSHCVIYSIPVETSINLAYTYGTEYTKDYRGTLTSNI